jgi:hypothetical protein
MKQQTTIDPTHAIPHVPRNTGPLAQQNSDPYSMLAEVVHGEEYVPVTVPGVLLHDLDFASGYYHGRQMYLEEVNELVDQAGKVIQLSIKASQFPVKAVKVRDITDQQVTDMVAEVMRPENAHELLFLNGKSAPMGWRAGMIFGYIHACIETARASQIDSLHNEASDMATEGDLS